MVQGVGVETRSFVDEIAVQGFELCCVSCDLLGSQLRALPEQGRSQRCDAAEGGAGQHGNGGD